jgi:thiol peroxidase
LDACRPAQYPDEDEENTLGGTTMQKRPNATTLKGSPLALMGPQLKAGDKAPDFVCATGMKETLTLAQTPAKARLFSVVPSLDTPVCSIQTKKFSDELAALGDKVACFTVSMDLPFAQKRFCGDKAITNLTNLSDTHNHSFGENYGVLIDGLALPLLSRAVFVVDKGGKVAYSEYVMEIASEPNYSAALSALKGAV